MTSFKTLVKSKSGGAPKAKELEDCCPPAFYPVSEWPCECTKIVKDITVNIDPATGKYAIVKHCLVWDESCLKWNETTEVLWQIPMIYGPGDMLPRFSGPLNVRLKDGKQAVIYGEQEIPTDMAGCVLCIAGDVKYLAEPIEEVQIDGQEPTPESSIKLWVDCGIIKYPTGSGWTQNKPYGA